MTGPQQPAQDDTGHRETASGIGAPNVAATGSAPCWRCKRKPGVVSDGYITVCTECAGLLLAESRQMLNDIDNAVREGLTCWPRIADRVEFVRECVKLHRAAPHTNTRR